ncbi:MAG: DUF167 domain-containing protein [Paracoccaceae bacterium]
MDESPADRVAGARGDWADLAVPGAEFALRVTPGARRNALTMEGRAIRIAVTAPPEDGKANAAVAAALAHALGVAKSRLTLIRGATARDKLFRLD